MKKDFADDAPPFGRAQIMVVERHGTIITYDVIFLRAKCFEFRLPIGARVFEIRFLQRLAIDIKSAALKTDQFARKTDDAFDEHDVVAGVADGHDVTPLRFAVKIGEPVEELDSSILKSGDHAGTCDANRRDDKTKNHKNNQRRNDDRAQPKQGALGAAPDGNDLDPIPHSHAFCFQGHNDVFLRLSGNRQNASRSGQADELIPVEGSKPALRDFLFTGLFLRLGFARMRMIGQVDSEEKARNFADYLYVQGIDNQIEQDKNGLWSVWIHREEDLERGRALLNNYMANPADPRFQNHTQAAEEMREQKRREQAEHEKKLKKGRQLFRPMATYGFGPVTSILIFISVIAFMDKYFHGGKIFSQLSLTQYDLKNIDDLGIWQALLTRISNFHELLPEIREGQVWRLVTPIFLHFTILHIFFNMLWLRDLGSMIEARQGSLLFVIQVLIIAVISNLTQFLFTGGGFGGMSGVVYGLFGYVWIRGKLDPTSGLYLHPTTVAMMMIWLFVCMIGVMGSIANAAHASGLLVGVIWGYLSSLRRR
ncbi:MAG TPA: rhomboid family intramembrane serine protease [Verrucomicrobiae bacterium]|nr:rhomboid family intramembrane serine protease [Verrucomicrobiae bacterium]